MKNKKYFVCDKETGTIIEYAESFTQAQELIALYESIDRKDNCYTEGFYEIGIEYVNGVCEYGVDY